MVRIHANDVIDLPVGSAFAYIADYRKMSDWVFGIKRIRPVGDQDSGIGAVFEGAVDLGPKALSSTFRLTDWQQDRLLGATSTAGFDFASTIRLSAKGIYRTGIDVDLDYEVTGGLFGKAVGRTLEPLIAVAVRHSLQSLRRECAGNKPSFRSR